MKVITVKGDTKLGKTQVIMDIFKELILLGGKELYFKEEGKDNRDFKALVNYKNKTIAFCSIGYIADYGHLESEYILSGIEFASKNEADILLNAYTTPFEEFPEPVYEGIIGKNNYHSFPVTKQTDLAGLKNQIISMISK